MLRFALALTLSFGCATFSVASEWRLERDASEVRILVASSATSADLAFSCEPGSGVFDWRIANLPALPGRSAIHFGTTWLGAGVIHRSIRVPYVRFDTRLISPANERALSGTSLVRLHDGPTRITFAQSGNEISLPGPALEAYGLLSHARAAETAGTPLRLGSYVFDVTGIDAAITRLTDACIGTRD